MLAAALPCTRACLGVKAERPKFLLLFAWSWKDSVFKKHDFKARLSIVPPTRAFRLEFREAPNRC